MRLHSFIHCTWDYSGVDNIQTPAPVLESSQTRVMGVHGSKSFPWCASKTTFPSSAECMACVWYSPQVSDLATIMLTGTCIVFLSHKLLAHLMHKVLMLNKALQAGLLHREIFVPIKQLQLIIDSTGLVSWTLNTVLL